VVSVVATPEDFEREIDLRGGLHAEPFEEADALALGYR
jgi:hypothetical protein